MAVIEEALVAILQADATVSGLVNDRIYPLVAPVGAELPAITYQRISGVRMETLQGPTGLAAPRFQFSCLANTYSQAKSLANAVRQALDGYSGTVNGVVIDSILCKNEQDGFNAADDENEESYLVYVDMTVWHHETP